MSLGVFLTSRAFSQQECESPDLDLSDDEELQQAFDMHSLIINSLHHEPVFTADQVINEIEGMMDEVSAVLVWFCARGAKAQILIALFRCCEWDACSVAL